MIYYLYTYYILFVFPNLCLFSAIEGTNVTYGIDMEMLNGGLLKRSVFDVSFENIAGGSSLLSVSYLIYSITYIACYIHLIIIIITKPLKII